jgi:hypothetical protein
VIRTRAGGERAAVRRLAGVIEAAFTPMRRTGDGLAALWSTYAFAKWPTGDAYAWHRAHDTTGVAKILHANGSERPIAVSPLGLVDGWIAGADADMVVRGLEPPSKQNNYSGLVGRRVRLLDGLTGIVRYVDERDWAMIHVEMFLRTHVVAMPAASLLGLPVIGQRRRRRRGKAARARRAELKF